MQASRSHNRTDFLFDLGNAEIGNHHDHHKNRNNSLHVFAFSPSKNVRACARTPPPGDARARAPPSPSNPMLSHSSGVIVTLKPVESKSLLPPGPGPAAKSIVSPGATSIANENGAACEIFSALSKTGVPLRRT